MAEKRRTREDIKRERKQQLKEKRANKSTLGKWLKRIIITCVSLAILGIIAGAGLFVYYASSAPELDEASLKDPVSSEFYDKNGEIFATLGAENRTYVEYEDIPKEMVDAIVATEDSRFFEHFGLDIWRLGGAVVANFRDGFGAQGGSTITQQVVKNSFLKNEKRLKRKAQEAWLAIQLERKYSKEEIFEMYFNKVLMSGRTYGFATAAEEFYGKELKDLTLDEMALLAGMPQSPNNYNPYKHPASAEKRRNIVLSLMVQHDKITEAEAEEAKSADVTADLLSAEDLTEKATTKYPAFLSVVLEELEENGDSDALAEGIKVYTTLDPDAQEIVENIMNDDDNFPTDEIKSGVAVVDTKTSAIRAIGGDRNYAGNLPYNYASDLTRDPGSTMKPLVAYGPAIEYLNWSTGQTLVDEPYEYSSGGKIGNWDGNYLGAMTARYALYSSRNVPAVKTLQEVGTDKSAEFISGLGLKTKSGAVYESDALGAGNIPITPLQMAASYAAFGNNGVYTDAHSITKIVYRDGVSTKDYTPKSNVAMSDYTAYMVTDILRDVVSSKEGASGSYAGISGIDIAGKTGTTNYSSDEFSSLGLPDSAVPDAWFSGYTSDYSIAIWSGYESRKDPITTWPERRLPQTLFKSIMSDLVDVSGKPDKIKQPSSVVSATIEVGSNPLKLASDYTPSNKRQTELFVAGTEPTKVSDKYVKLELEAPTNVSATYNEVGQSIDVSWSHKAPESEERDMSVTFEVSMSIDGGASTVISTTGANSVTVPNAQPGSTYTFTVVAIAKDSRSSGGSTSITIDGGPVEDEEEEGDEGVIEEPTEPTEPSETETDPNDGNNEEQQPTEPTDPSTTDPYNPDNAEQGQDDNTGALDPSQSQQPQQGTPPGQ